METRFEFKDFAKVFGLGIFLYAFSVLLFGLFPQVSELLNSLHPTLAFSLQYLLQLLILFIPLWIFVVGKYQATAFDFGFMKVGIWKFASTVLSSYVFYFILTIIISSILYKEQIDLPGYRPQESHLPLFGTDMIGVVGATFFIVIVAPLFEEIFFRGFVYRVLAKTWSVGFGSFMSAILFALFHFEFQSFIPLFILGLILNYNYQRTSSLWTAIGFHALNNGIAFSLEVFLYYNPGALNDLVNPLGLF